jgi:hypothetical protein
LQGTLLAEVDGGRRGMPGQRANDQANQQQTAQPGQAEPPPAPMMTGVIMPAHDEAWRWS